MGSATSSLKAEDAEALSKHELGYEEYLFLASFIPVSVWKETLEDKDLVLSGPARYSGVADFKTKGHVTAYEPKPLVEHVQNLGARNFGIKLQICPPEGCGGLHGDGKLKDKSEAEEEDCEKCEEGEDNTRFVLRVGGVRGMHVHQDGGTKLRVSWDIPTNRLYTGRQSFFGRLKCKLGFFWRHRVLLPRDQAEALLPCLSVVCTFQTREDAMESKARVQKQLLRLGHLKHDPEYQGSGEAPLIPCLDSAYAVPPEEASSPPPAAPPSNTDPGPVIQAGLQRLLDLNRNYRKPAELTHSRRIKVKTLLERANSGKPAAEWEGEQGRLLVRGNGESGKKSNTGIGGVHRRDEDRGYTYTYFKAELTVLPGVDAFCRCFSEVMQAALYASLCFMHRALARTAPGLDAWMAAEENRKKVKNVQEMFEQDLEMAVAGLQKVKRTNAGVTVESGRKKHKQHLTKETGRKKHKQHLTEETGRKTPAKRSLWTEEEETQLRTGRLAGCHSAKKLAESWVPSRTAQQIQSKIQNLKKKAAKSGLAT